MATKAEDFKSYRSPDAITEEYTIPDTDLTVKIVGIKMMVERAKVQAEIEHYLELTRWPPNSPDSRLVDPQEWQSACWASFCVEEPKLSVEEWLDWGHHNPNELIHILNRCLICSRLTKDKDIPDGIRAAKNELTEPGKAADPFPSDS
jgi:hypothetical protein